MGASAWAYFVPYEQDIFLALRNLCQQVFAEGNYFQPWKLYDAPAPDSLPQTIEELVEYNGASGTHSILDLYNRLALEPFPEEVILHLFGTVHPTRDRVEAGWDALWDMLTSDVEAIADGIVLAGGDYIILYHDGLPTEIVFLGASGD